MAKQNPEKEIIVTKDEVTVLNTPNLDVLSKLINNEIYQYMIRQKRSTDYKFIFEKLNDYLKDLQMYNIYVLLQSVNLIKITEKTFSDELYTDFILSVSTALTIRTFVENNKSINVDSLQRYLVDSICVGEKYNEGSILPNDTKNSTVFNVETVALLLENNNWLLWLIYILLFFEEPNTYQ